MWREHSIGTPGKYSPDPAPNTFKTLAAESPIRKQSPPRLNTARTPSPSRRSGSNSLPPGSPREAPIPKSHRSPQPHYTIGESLKSARKLLEASLARHRRESDGVAMSLAKSRHMRSNKESKAMSPTSPCRSPSPTRSARESPARSRSPRVMDVQSTRLF